MEFLDNHPHFVGYYTQPYNDIIQSKQIWHVSKYLLRRWGPYLSPARFWTVVAAQQMAYWNNKADWFTAYDGRMAQESHVSCAHYRRIKSELEDAQNPISLFLSRGATEYHVVAGQTRPKPTHYRVRLDDPLTPADAHHLTIWLQRQQLPRRAEGVIALLQEATQLPRRELLAPSPGPYLAESPAHFRPLHVKEVLSRVYGNNVVQNDIVQEHAEALHRHLTGPEYIGTQYFRRQWLPSLKAGPAYLITYLRSLCYYSEQTGERRDEVTFTRPELADKIGITTKTLANWLRKLEKAAIPQTIPPFLTEIERQRISSNDVAYTYQVGLTDPLIKSDLKEYKARIVEVISVLEGKNERHGIVTAVPPEGKNERHDGGSVSSSQGKNERHVTPGTTLPEGKNDSHDKNSQATAQGKNERHDAARNEKMIRGQGKNDQGSGKKRASFKYYKHLYQSIMTESSAQLTFAAFTRSAGWYVTNGRAGLPFAEAVSGGNIAHLFDLIQVDAAGPMRQRMVQSGLSLVEMMAWHLYALQQQGLTKAPVTLTIKRVEAGQQPPQRYLRLAGLRWELWRCYAALLLLPPAYRDLFQNAPAYRTWMEAYGRLHPDEIPFGAGKELAEEIPAFLYEAGRSERVATPVAAGSGVSQQLWQPVLAQLQYAMNRVAFQTWLASSRLLHVEEEKAEQRWQVGLGSEQAVEWVTTRVNQSVIEPMAGAIHGKPVSISYCADRRRAAS